MASRMEEEKAAATEQAVDPAFASAAAAAIATSRTAAAHSHAQHEALVDELGAGNLRAWVQEHQAALEADPGLHAQSEGHAAEVQMTGSEEAMAMLRSLAPPVPPLTAGALAGGIVAGGAEATGAAAAGAAEAFDPHGERLVRETPKPAGSADLRLPLQAACNCVELVVEDAAVPASIGLELVLADAGSDADEDATVLVRVATAASKAGFVGVTVSSGSGPAVESMDVSCAQGSLTLRLEVQDDAVVACVPLAYMTRYIGKVPWTRPGGASDLRACVQTESAASLREVALSSKRMKWT